jgi:hypothetical protein
LATVINHPVLFDELIEVFAEVTLPVAWEPLRQALFDVLAAESLDADALGVHLRSSGYAPVLEDVLGPGTTSHARFVAADTPLDRVRAGWSDVWSRAHNRTLDRELAGVRADPNRVEDKVAERIGKLVERRHNSIASGEQETAPIGVDHQAVVARAIADALKAPVKDASFEGNNEGDF